MNDQNYSEAGLEPAPGCRVAFTPGPSSLARGWAYVVGGLGLGVCLWLPQAPAWRGVAFVAVLLATLRAACALGCGAGSGPRRVEVGKDGRVHVQRASGEVEAGEISAGTVVLTRLVVLRYRVGRGLRSRAMVVTHDAVADDTFRRLRLLLRAR